MTTAIGALVDAPAPRPPLYTLLGAANIVPMGADEHYLLGVEVRSLPITPSDSWNWQTHLNGGGGGTKVTSLTVPSPSFGGFTVYVREQCNARGLGAQLYAERAEAWFAAVEAYAVEREFWTGASNPLTPHLAGAIPVPGGPDLTAYPAGDTPLTLIEGLTLLEGCIAETGRAGMIHLSPTAFTRLVRTGTGVVAASRTTPAILQTMLGTIVVPGYGYQDAATLINNSTPVPPTGHAAPTGTQEWMFATGLVDIRRQQDVTLTPEATEEALWQALDRGQNQLAYEASRAYVFDWDAFKAAVLIDRAT